MNRAMYLLLIPGLLSSIAMSAQPWKIEWSMPVRLPMGLAGPLAGVDHDHLLIAGGCNFPDSMPWAGGKKKYYDAVYVLERRGDRYEWVASGKYHLPESTAYGASVSTPQGVVYMGGENEKGISSKVFLLQWKPEGVHLQPLPDLPVALTNAAAALLGQTIYIAGGETSTGVSDQLYALDLATLRWRSVARMPKPLSHAVLVAASHRLYLVGGRKKNPGAISDLSRDVYSYDPEQDRWSSCRGLLYPLSAGTGVLYDEHRLLLLGGDKGETFHEVEKLIAAIDTTADASRKQALLLQKVRVQSTHPGFSKEVLVYDRRRDEWNMVDTLPFPAPATTTALRWKDSIVIAGGEIRAGVRTPDIWIGTINHSNSQ